MNDALRNTTGPRPSSGGYEVNPPSDTKALTYGLRFGKRDVWKIGWSTDVDARCADINQHIPVELGLEKWGVVLTQSMETHDAAYDMEQRVLELLASKRKGFERVHCTREEVESAWQRAFVDIIRRI